MGEKQKLMDYIYILYTYIHTHVHTYIHTYIHTHVHTYIHTYIHTFVRLSVVAYSSAKVICDGFTSHM